MDSDGQIQSLIQEADVVELALALGRIDSPSGHEGAVSDYVYNWMQAEGVEPERVGIVPERCNVAGILRGTGGGPTLLLNSHLDTSVAADEYWSTPHAADPVYHTAWREGEVLVGNGVANNKGHMAAWLIAARAIRRSGVKLKGNVLLTASVAEIGIEPVDEFTAPRYLSKEAGTRYLITRGYVPDYALVAEGTDFALGWVEAGKAFCKITLHGVEPPIYTPYIRRPTPPLESPNAIVRMAAVVQAIEAWALRYEQEHRFECAGGTVVPRVNIGAIRGGAPYKATKTAGTCAIYLDVRATPAQRVLDVRRELEALLDGLPVAATVELYGYRRGFEAQGVEPLVEKVRRAHRQTFGGETAMAATEFTSMWRDINPFSEAGIPAIMYGPGVSIGTGNFTIGVQALTDAARVYARIMLETAGLAEV